MARLLIGSLLTIVLGLALLGCTTTNPATSLNRLSNDEIEAYNNDPSNTDKIICTNEKPTGSRIAKRECYKESYIKRRTQHDQRALKKGQERSTDL
jgi:hypothetical protein